MRLQLVAEWRAVIRHAWSVRLNIIIAIGTAFGVAASAGPDRPLFVVILLSQFAPIIARLVAQKDLP